MAAFHLGLLGNRHSCLILCFRVPLRPSVACELSWSRLPLLASAWRSILGLSCRPSSASCTFCAGERVSTLMLRWFSTAVLAFDGHVSPRRASCRKFGGNVCGEGGEFETLVVDAPLFTHAKIELESWEPYLASPDALAPVAYMNNIRWSLASKREGEPAPSARIEWVEDDVESAVPVSHLASARPGSACEASVQTWPSENLLRVSATVLRSSDGEDAAMHAALSAVQEALSVRDLSFSDALFVHLFVPSMRRFAAVNAVYLRFLPAANPPARATVELEGEGTVVDVLVAMPGGGTAPRSLPRKTLHVQSISDWAPACIGPYAQSVAHAGLVFFAGQIGLDPGSMELVAGGALAQCRRCLLSSQVRLEQRERVLSEVTLLHPPAAHRSLSPAERRRRAANAPGTSAPLGDRVRRCLCVG